MSQKWMLRRMCGPKGESVIGSVEKKKKRRR
jgi:hypothetical protein